MKIKQTKAFNIKDVESLQQKGLWADAIKILTEANRQQTDTVIEKKLAELRIRAFEEIDWLKKNGNNKEEWSPQKNDNFETFCQGIPEITQRQLNAQTLAGGVLNHGSMIVRNLVPKELIQELIDDIDHATDGRDSWVNAKRENKPEQSPWFSPPECLSHHKLGVGRKFIAQTGGVWTIDSPRSLFHVSELYKNLGLTDLLEGYFGEPPCASVRKWVLRRTSPLKSAPDWHQDGQFMGTRIRSVNLWIALSRCGGDSDAPGIEIVPKRLESIVETDSHGASLDWTVSSDLVKESFADTPPVTPLFEAGDAIFFDHFNLHRTAYSPELSKDRYAIECWFFSPTHYSEEQIPIVL